MKNGNSEEKSIRILKIMKRLNQKEIVNRSDLANEFKVDKKTIQRDIATLRNYFFEEGESDIKYSSSKKRLLSWKEWQDSFYKRRTFGYK